MTELMAFGKIKYISILFLFVTSAHKTWSQNPNSADSTQQKLSLYAKAHPSGLLFLHTDKTLYTNNETIWFSGYLLKSGLGKISAHTILSISLIREDDRKIFLGQQHVMTRGLSSGSLIIPDNIPPGNYMLNAYTNILDQNAKPLAVFSQPLTIKTTSQKPFNASLTLLDTAAADAGGIRSRINVNISDKERKGRAMIAYHAGKGKEFNVTLGEKENSKIISIPAAQSVKQGSVLMAAVSYDHDTVYLSTKLPDLKPKRVNIRFFPEGGTLSAGLESTVALEATNQAGSPVALTGTLCGDDKPLETISTNSYGVGRFRLIPDNKTRYTFKVRANNYLARDTSYALPNSVEEGVVMHFNEATVNDTLYLTLHSRSAKKVKVVVHNAQEVFNVFDTEANFNGKKVMLTISGLPKGIATITVLDQDGRPLAERLFFAHYDHRINASIKPERTVYKPRDSVAVKISLKDENGNPVRGLFSVAVVQENRIEGAKQMDIESYTYLYHDLGPLPRDPQGRGFSNKAYLEDMFLTKGWRKYTWQDMVKTGATDTLSVGSSPEFRGQVFRYGRALKKPVDLLILRDSKIDKVSTAADGSFTLGRDQLTVKEGRKVILWVNGSDEKEYDIQVTDPFRKTNLRVADEITIANHGPALAAQNSLNQQLKGLERNIMLNTVNIKAEKADSFLYGIGKTNDCGDYVCQYGVLNCNIHTAWNSHVRLPVKGERVSFLSVSSGEGLGIYQGCISNGQRTPAIYATREFYGLNRLPEGISEPQYLSTLLWKPEIITNEKGETNLIFFTGDITGKFRIVVQGVCPTDTIFGVSDFMVK